MLAEVKSKQKWSDDPRNTKWSSGLYWIFCFIFQIVLCWCRHSILPFSLTRVNHYLMSMIDLPTNPPPPPSHLKTLLHATLR